MLICLQCRPPMLYQYVHELIRLAFPTADLRPDVQGEADLVICLAQELTGNQIKINGWLEKNGERVQQEVSGAIDQRKVQQQIKKWSVLCVYRLLQDVCGPNINAYGLLTGMRPVKLVHKLWDQMQDLSMVRERLQRDYLVREDKIDLLLKVAGNQRQFLFQAAAQPGKVALYIGIPFCPSRCYYCSFPGAVLKDYDQDMRPYLQALWREMKIVGTELQALGFSVQSVYLGGGTPTVLRAEDLEQLFHFLRTYMQLELPAEITVEAGRPDTISPEKLKVFNRHGVNRICINPQTSQEQTLKAIGRQHSWSQVVEAVHMAREAGIAHINMDMILGLPGETIDQNLQTAQALLELAVDNITLHALAVKRGSDLAIQDGKTGLRQDQDHLPLVRTRIDRWLQNANYQPYYLYRQKYVKANLENVGYGLPGAFCLYNIQVMEERQTLLGLGGGGASKFIAADLRHRGAVYNPKNPEAYAAHLEPLIQRKVDNLRALI